MHNNKLRGSALTFTLLVSLGGFSSSLAALGAQSTPRAITSAQPSTAVSSAVDASNSASNNTAKFANTSNEKLNNAVNSAIEKEPTSQTLPANANPANLNTSPLTFAKAQPIEEVVKPKPLKFTYSYFKNKISDYFFGSTVADPLQGAQTVPLLLTNKGYNIRAVSNLYPDYLIIYQTKGPFEVKNGNYVNKVSGLGTEEQYKKRKDSNIFAYLASNIANALATIEPANADGSLRHRFSVEQLIIKAGQALGFYQLEVRFTHFDDKSLTVVINPGKPALITNQSQLIVRGQGTGFEAYQKLGKTFFAPEGKVFLASDYSKAKGSLSGIANDFGYFDAKYERSQIALNPQSQKATWYLDFNTGNRYRLGSVKVDSSYIDSELLENGLSLHSGDYFSANEVASSISLLQGTKYFDSVLTTSEINKKEKTVALTFITKKAKPNNIDLSLGYDTDEGMRTKANYNRYYISRGGTSFKASGYYSKLKQIFDFNFQMPQFSDPFTKSWTGGFSFERIYQKAENNYSRSIISYLSYQRLPPNNWQFATTLYNRKDFWFEFGESHQSFQTYADFLLARSSLNTKVQLIYKTNFLLDKVIEALPAYHYWGLNLGHLIPLTSKIDINLGLRLGQIINNDIFTLPPTMRLYSGGKGSVRGYAYQSLSDYKGIPDHGGKAKTEFTAEFMHQIIPNLKGVVFVDGGNSTDHISFSNLHYGTGVGVRYYLPVGFASFDIAYPIQRPFKWRNASLYLGIQTQF